MPELADALYFGHDGNHGDPLLGGPALGAAGRHLSAPGPWSGGTLITWATITEGGVQVNVKGRRFSNETLGHSEQSRRRACPARTLCLHCLPRTGRFHPQSVRGRRCRLLGLGGEHVGLFVRQRPLAAVSLGREAGRAAVF